MKKLILLLACALACTAVEVFAQAGAAEAVEDQLLLDRIQAGMTNFEWVNGRSSVSIAALDSSQTPFTRYFLKVENAWWVEVTSSEYTTRRAAVGNNNYGTYLQEQVTPIAAGVHPSHEDYPGQDEYVPPPPPPDPVELPAIGDPLGYVQAAIELLGTIAATVLGGFFSFWLMKKVMRWSSAIG